MGIFDRSASADVADAFNRKRGQAKPMSALRRMAQRAIAAVSLVAVTSSGFADIKGAALFHSFRPEPAPATAPAALMVRVANDNRSPAFSTRFLDPAHVPIRLAPQPVAVPAPAASAFASVSASASEQPAPGKRKLLTLSDEKAAALVRTVAQQTPKPAAPSLKADVNMAALPRPKSNKSLKPNFRVERVDMASAPGLTRDSSLEHAAVVYQAEKRRMETPQAPVKLRSVNPLHDKIMADFKRELQAATGQETVAVVEMQVPVHMAATCRNDYNMASAGVPRAVEKMRPAAPARSQPQNRQSGQTLRLAG
jgi:hypothetical protein